MFHSCVEQRQGYVQIRHEYRYLVLPVSIPLGRPALFGSSMLIRCNCHALELATSVQSGTISCTVFRIFNEHLFASLENFLFYAVFMQIRLNFFERKSALTSKDLFRVMQEFIAFESREAWLIKITKSNSSSFFSFASFFITLHAIRHWARIAWKKCSFKVCIEFFTFVQSDDI